MAEKRSSGLLLHRTSDDGVLEVLLVHPGGPFWARKDAGAWSVPKGEHGADEDPRAVAVREFTEELGSAPPKGDLRELGVVRQKAGKVVTAYALEADHDVAGFRSNTFEIEWPPRSGAVREFPEVDRAEWFTLADARRRLLEAQVPLLDMLVAQLAGLGRDVLEE